MEIAASRLVALTVALFVSFRGVTLTSDMAPSCAATVLVSMTKHLRLTGLGPGQFWWCAEVDGSALSLALRLRKPQVRNMPP